MLRWGWSWRPEPTLNLLHADCVPGGGFAHLDVENGRGPHVIDPRIPSEDPHSQDRCLVERFGLHLRLVPDAADVHERDGAGPQLHGRES